MKILKLWAKVIATKWPLQNRKGILLSV